MSEQNEIQEKSIVTAYKPSELIAIFNATLGKQNEFAKLVSLRGIYQQRLLADERPRVALLLPR